MIESSIFMNLLRILLGLLFLKYVRPAEWRGAQ